MNINIKEVMKEITLEEKASLCSGADFWNFKGVERLEIPSMMVCDGPHGLRKQEGLTADMLGMGESIKAVCFPTASALASSFDRELLNKVGKSIGTECQSENIGVVLGPGVNIKRSPLCGRNFEYFSEDPYLSSEVATAYIQGVQSMNVGTSMKHYLANNQETKRMTADSIVDERTLYEIYLASFEGAVKNAQPKSVMCSYNKINGTYAAENKTALTEILREKWGFEGCVITDWGAVKDRVTGIKAGLDIEMPGNGGFTDAQIVEAVKNGSLDEKDLDATVERILKMIEFCTSNRSGNIVFDHEKDHILAGEVEKECAVLLKNEEQILPLSSEAKVAFIGAFAEKPRFQGSGSSYINCKYKTSVLEASKGNENITFAKGYEEKDEENEFLLQEAIQCAKEAEVAVVFAGLPNSFESEGFDRKHLGMPENQNNLIKKIAKIQPNLIVVLHNGAPVEMPWNANVKAILEMYLGGENVGTATYDLLYGKANPSGKLAETFPLKLSDNPSYLNFPGSHDRVEYREGIYVGYRYYDKKEMDVLYPFGHGLSYSKFTYDDIRLNKTSMIDQEELKVSVTITNRGDRVGKEVVQVYVTDKETTIDRPLNELKGFQKIELQPGESKEVNFSLGKRAFAYYNTILHDWHVETGEFVINIGSSSRDIRLQKSVIIESTVDIPVTFNRYSTFGDIIQTKKGQAIFEAMMVSQTDAATIPEMGKGSDEMVAAMMYETPLSTMVSFGGMKEEQIQELLNALNN